MQELKYSDDLAGKANKYVAGCKATKPNTESEADYAGLGMTTLTNPGDDLKKAILDTYNDEGKNYDYGSNNCSGTCDNYKQAVWANTTEVGCAKNECPEINSQAAEPESPPEPATKVLIVCFYRPT
ncbi:unnamed protein product [Mesocestoides corti]|uniref:SCP domain-containing protein n=2 Tax=Mesocestoides corti TaxID=53468 RepID=A0A0R3U5K1_MESCO|nr:unnamed protein product [Mesocestoides corti]